MSETCLIVQASKLKKKTQLQDQTVHRYNLKLSALRHLLYKQHCSKGYANTRNDKTYVMKIQRATPQTK